MLSPSQNGVQRASGQDQAGQLASGWELSLLLLHVHPVPVAGSSLSFLHLRSRPDPGHRHVWPQSRPPPHTLVTADSLAATCPRLLGFIMPTYPRSDFGHSPPGPHPGAEASGGAGSAALESRPRGQVVADGKEGRLAAEERGRQSGLSAWRPGLCDPRWLSRASQARPPPVNGRSRRADARTACWRRQGPGRRLPG